MSLRHRSLAYLAALVLSLSSSGCSSQLSPGDYLSDSRLGIPTAHRTVLFLLSDQCAGCTKNMPIYRRLAGRRAKAGMRPSNLRFVLATELGRGQAVAFLESNHLQMDEVISLSDLSDRMLHHEARPTLLLLDSAGMIRDMWRGPIDIPGEIRLLSTLFPFG